MSTQDNTQDPTFVTLDDIFAEAGIEIRNYVNKEEVANNNLPFCITSIELVDVKDSQFNIPQQWKLDVIVSLKDDLNSQRVYWMTFIPNEVRNEQLTKMQEALNKLPETNRVIHGCKLEAIPVKRVDGKFFQINTSLEQCSCVNATNE